LEIDCPGNGQRQEEVEEEHRGKTDVQWPGEGINHLTTEQGDDDGEKKDNILGCPGELDFFVVFGDAKDIARQIKSVHPECIEPEDEYHTPEIGGQKEVKTPDKQRKKRRYR